MKNISDRGPRSSIETKRQVYFKIIQCIAALNADILIEGSHRLAPAVSSRRKKKVQIKGSQNFEDIEPFPYMSLVDKYDRTKTGLARVRNHANEIIFPP